MQGFVAELADAAARRWRETDAGMCEMRGEPRHHWLVFRLAQAGELERRLQCDGFLPW